MYMCILDNPLFLYIVHCIMQYPSCVCLYVQLTTAGFIGHDKADDIEAFFKANPVPNADRTVKQALEAIRMNTAWLGRDGKAIQEWLNSLN